MTGEPTDDEIRQSDIEWKKLRATLVAKQELLAWLVAEAEKELEEYDRAAAQRGIGNQDVLDCRGKE